MHGSLIDRLLLVAMIALLGVVVGSFIWELPAPVVRAAPMALAGTSALAFMVHLKRGERPGDHARPPR